MTLLKFINSLPEGTAITIGAASGWLFFGTREEYLCKYKEIDAEYFYKTKKIFEDAKHYYKKYLPSIEPKKRSYKLKPLKKKVKSKEPNEKGIYEYHLEPIPFDEARKMWEFRHNQARYNLEKWNMYWKNYIKLSSRPILKAYRKKIDTDIGILIPGCENGNYWLRSEWEADKNDNN